MLVWLNCNKILRVDHHDLVLAFLRFQIKQFDNFHKKAEKYAADAETISKEHIEDAKGSRHTVTIPSPGMDHVIILGSKRSATIEELENREKDLAFTSFCSRLSIAIQALSTSSGPTVAVNNSHQV